MESNYLPESVFNAHQLSGLKRTAPEAMLNDCYLEPKREKGKSKNINISHRNTEDNSSKCLLPNGKKTKGRVKIKMEFIDNKLRRYTTFSKRKTGIMKKAYELSTLTGTQVMLLVASETGHVYTFATRKLQPMITSEAGKALIQTCLNSPDPVQAESSPLDQRMSAAGFEETDLSYAVNEDDDGQNLQEQDEDTEEGKVSDDDNVDCPSSYSPPPLLSAASTLQTRPLPSHTHPLTKYAISSRSPKEEIKVYEPLLTSLPSDSFSTPNTHSLTLLRTSFSPQTNHTLHHNLQQHSSQSISKNNGISAFEQPQILSSSLQNSISPPRSTILRLNNLSSGEFHPPTTVLSYHPTQGLTSESTSPSPPLNVGVDFSSQLHISSHLR